MKTLPFSKLSTFALLLLGGLMLSVFYGMNEAFPGSDTDHLSALVAAQDDWTPTLAMPADGTQQSVLQLLAAQTNDAAGAMLVAVQDLAAHQQER